MTHPPDAGGPATVAAIVVAYGDPDQVVDAVDALRAQSRVPDAIIVVDNHPDASTASRLAADEDVTVIVATENTGFAGGVSMAAQATDAEVLFIVNPDAKADVHCLERLLAVCARDEAIAIVGAQVLMPDGTTSGGANPVHPTGLSWGGRHLLPREHGEPRPVPAISGAAFVARSRHFHALGGLTERYFLYCEDTDLCWRARLAGLQVWYSPEAVVTHDYTFHKGTAKWRYLERNRMLMVGANFDAVTLVLLVPMFAGLEIGIWIVAISGGWAAEKRRAWRDVWEARHWLRRRRHAVQATRRVPDSRLLMQFSPTIDTPLLTSAVLSAVAEPMRWYLSALIRMLRLLRR